LVQISLQGNRWLVKQQLAQQKMLQVLALRAHDKQQAGNTFGSSSSMAWLMLGKARRCWAGGQPPSSTTLHQQQQQQMVLHLQQPAHGSTAAAAAAAAVTPCHLEMS
jgi:hypothetical protein